MKSNSHTDSVNLTGLGMQSNHKETHRIPKHINPKGIAQSLNQWHKLFQIRTKLTTLSAAQTLLGTGSLAEHHWKHQLSRRAGPKTPKEPSRLAPPCHLSPHSWLKRLAKSRAERVPKHRKNQVARAPISPFASFLTDYACSKEKHYRGSRNSHQMHSYTDLLWFWYRINHFEWK